MWGATPFSEDVVKLTNEGIKFDDASEHELADSRLKKGKCAYCGREKTLTPGFVIGKRCMQEVIALNGGLS